MAKTENKRMKEAVKKEGGKESVTRKKKKHSWLTYILCLLLALCIWLAVMWVNPPKTETVFHDIPLILTGTEDAEDAGYFCLADDTVSAASFRGTRMQLSAVRGKVTAKADVSDVVPALGTADIPVSFSGLGEVEVARDVTVKVTFVRRADGGST